MSSASATVTGKVDLTLAELARYDDLVTDALVDHVYFWTTIRKNRARYASSRFIKEEEIADIIRKAVIVEHDAGKGLRQLQALPGITRHLNGLRTINEKEHFMDHLRKYVDMYLPDASFEVSTTNRYTISTQEAAITARKEISRGHVIKYLTGIQVQMTDEEVRSLDLTCRDFSIVMAGRKRKPSLFLGPARFANHDCDANARLTIKGINGMEVVARKDIAIGDEITVSYGDDYFGIDNRECLCATCEKLRRNGWAITNSDGEKDHTAGTTTSRLNSPRTPRSGNDSHLATPAASQSPARPTDTVSNHSAVLDGQAHVGVFGGNVINNTQVASSSPAKRGSSQAMTSKLSQVISADDINDAPIVSEVDAHSVADMALPTPRKSKSPVTPHRGSEPTVVESETIRVTTTIEDNVRPAEASAQPDAFTGSDELSSHSESTASGANSKKPRKPGDYTLTRALLGMPHIRWVKCQDCVSFFAQTEAFQTRRACPRCERHSKLYGYKWPKTDKESWDDKEERVADHRTINRFVGVKEEKEIRKGKKTTEQLLAEFQEKEQRRALGLQDEEPDDEEEDEALTPRRSRRKGTALQYRAPSETPVRSGKTEAEAAEDSSTSDFISSNKKRKVLFAPWDKSLEDETTEPSNRSVVSGRFQKSRKLTHSLMDNSKKRTMPARKVAKALHDEHIDTNENDESEVKTPKNGKLKSKLNKKRKHGDDSDSSDEEQRPSKRGSGASRKSQREPSPSLVSSTNSADSELEDSDASEDQSEESGLAEASDDEELEDELLLRKFSSIKNKPVRNENDAWKLIEAADLLKQQIKKQNKARYNKVVTFVMQMQDKALQARYKLGNQKAVRIKKEGRATAKPKKSSTVSLQSKVSKKPAVTGAARVTKTVKGRVAGKGKGQVRGVKAKATKAKTRPYTWSGNFVKTERGAQRAAEAMARASSTNPTSSMAPGISAFAPPKRQPGKLKRPTKKAKAAPVNTERTSSVEEVSDEEWSAELSAVKNVRQRLDDAKNSR
ncbi:MAG: Histone-lysine N-methyltransferase set9 [Chrysothrix sp. TS-e1954]|nr:MAG: Histone-lysine N-methyltransferase set9 [Chrysothrix sp. TS-e1954]